MLPDEAWACAQLSADGEEIAGRALLPQYLVVALVILAEPLGMAVLEADHKTAPQAASLDVGNGVLVLGSCPQDAALQKVCVET